MKFLILGSEEFAQNYLNDHNYGGLLTDVMNISEDCTKIIIELSPNFNKYFSFYLRNSSILNNYDVSIESVEARGIETIFWNLFQEFDEMSKLTQGFLSLFDVAGIIVLLLQKIKKENLTSIRGLEVGSWTGFSAYLITKSINSFTQGNKLFCVDTWGDPSGSQPNGEYADFVDVLHIFRSLMKGKGVLHNIRTFAAPNREALPMFQSDLFDFIFLDGDHRYDAVFMEILLSIDKIKEGGLLMGHDYFHYDDPQLNPPLEFIRIHKNDHEIKYEGRTYSAGVNLAVGELLGEVGLIPHSSVWYKSITSSDKKKAKDMLSTLKWE